MNQPPRNTARRRALKIAAAFGSTFVLAPHGFAQAGLGKPIKVVVAFPPGASNDMLGRLLTAEFVKGFAPGSIVDNRPGAGGVLAAQFVAPAPADWTTLLIVSFPFPLINSMYKQSRLDVTRDFVAIGTLCSTPNVVAVRTESPFQTMADLLAGAKATPNKITFASTGNGTSPHLGMELIMQQTGTKFVHVPYKGSAPATTDLLGGQVDFTVDNLLNALPNIRAGKMRALAVTSSKRSPVLPNIPTLAEAGVPGVTMDIWIGVVAPATTPTPVVEMLNKEINRIIELPETRQRFADLGMDAMTGPPDRLRTMIAADVVKWGDVVRAANLTTE